jgi:hypothetical protein
MRKRPNWQDLLGAVVRLRNLDGLPVSGTLVEAGPFELILEQGGREVSVFEPGATLLEVVTEPPGATPDRAA